MLLVVLGYTRLLVPQEKMGSGSTNKPSKPAAQEGKEGSQTKQDPRDGGRPSEGEGPETPAEKKTIERLIEEKRQDAEAKAAAAKDAAKRLGLDSDEDPK